MPTLIPRFRPHKDQLDALWRLALLNGYIELGGVTAEGEDLCKVTLVGRERARTLLRDAGEDPDHWEAVADGEDETLCFGEGEDEFTLSLSSVYVCLAAYGFIWCGEVPDWRFPGDP